jgi:hypothetical protein
MKGPIVIDTNLLVLLVVGLTNISYIEKHKRLSSFDKVDFSIATNLIDNFSNFVFTPNVISETSNLIRYLNSPIKEQVSDMFSTMICRSPEIYIESCRASRRPEYRRLGVTDSVLLELLEQGGTLFTDDLDLFLAAQSAGFEAINYNHLREQRPDYRS